MSVSSIFLLGSIAALTIFIGLRALRCLIYCIKQKKYFVGYIHMLIKILKGQSFKTIALEDLEGICRRNRKKDMVKLWFGKPAVMVFNTEGVKFLLNEPAVDDKPTEFKMMKVLFGNTIFLSTGEIWKKQKKILRPAFLKAELQQKFCTFNEQSRRLVESLSNLENNTTNDLMHVLKDFALRTFMESLLGLEENNSFETGFFQNFRENIMRLIEFIPERVGKIWLYPDFCLHIFPEGRKILKTRDELCAMVHKILEKMKKEVLASKSETGEINHPKPKLLGESLIEEHLKDPSFTMTDLVKEMMALFGAGYETTAITCMWCLYLLGLHQDVQNLLLLELQMLNENITYEDLPNMEYLDCVLKESMRIYATVPIIARCASKDFQFGKSKIRKGQSIIIPLFMVFKDQDLYPDPEKFDPERFRSTKEGGSERLYYAPFAEGHRPCIGKAYAMYFLKVMIAHVIRNFQVISLDRREDVELSWHTVLQPLKPLRMKFIPRDTMSDI